MKRPVDSIVSIASEYANLIMTGEGDPETIASLREQLGFTASSPQVDDTAEAQTFRKALDPSRVGIWKLQSKNGEDLFVRDQAFQNEFYLWAKNKEIPAKGDKYRIAFAGESVARGFLYDPFITPAILLEKLLNLNASREIEVIDLARTSIKIAELTEVCYSSVNLKPDALVVFAGNNWRDSILPLSDSEIADMIKAGEKDDNFESLQSLMEETYKNIITPFMDALKEISDKHQIPVFFIIPEFNLKDWKYNSNEKILTWPHGKAEEWFALVRDAESALLENDYARLEATARQMIAVNVINPSGYHHLAQCKLHAGNLEEARKHLEAARDTMAYQVGSVPGILSVMRDTILEKASQHHIRTIDLQTVFKDHLNGDIPGNDLFIDYCHLTVEGMNIAMQETAKQLLPLIGETLEKTISPKELKGAQEVIAVAHLYAAIHNAHRGGQSYEMLYYHSSQALRHSKNIVSLMTKYIDIATRKVPWAINKNYTDIFSEGLNAQYPILVQSKDSQIMDVELVTAMVNALKETGVDIQKEVEQLRINEHKPRHKKVNLLESFYKDTYYLHEFGNNPDRNLSYVRAIDHQSHFYFVADQENDVSLELTFRVPYKESVKQDVRILFNGTEIGKTAGYDEWSNFTCRVSKGLLAESGVNTITIEWPVTETNRNPKATDLEKHFSGLHLLSRKSRPSYGEIMFFAAGTAEE
ncbi:tetratricopeptide repeat protein [Brevibacillus dissolubilis]|uniref:tetratricopeptide repeat protein n=1 Tax=Brevibacillus dissolubilis TaxID=1844116 RepID=UPI0011165087|nr:hypothetical protein [Brevibacillus dissolubilis]